MQGAVPDPDRGARPGAVGPEPGAGAGAIAALRFAAERRAIGLRRARASVWFHGAAIGAFESAAGLLGEVMQGRGDLALVLTAPDRQTVAALRRFFPDDVAVAAPAGTAGSFARFRDRLRPCVLVLLGGEDTLDAATLARAAGSGLALCRVAGSIDPGLSARIRALLPARGVDVGASGGWRLPTLRDRAGASRAWRAAGPLFARGRIDDWDELRERLARPRSILCLGNGPSSEDPRLLRLEHDCLIRSNWRWRDRGFLDRPQMVFVGDPATLHRVPPCVFGIWSVELERGMLLRHLVVRGPAAMEFVTLERISPLAARSRWPSRPSNGALSIVAAAALAPERLVIGGMDLFLHPGGRYAGAERMRNAYSSAHDRDTEVAIVDLALRDFRGEVVILSDVLRERLDRMREEAGRAR